MKIFFIIILTFFMTSVYFVPSACANTGDAPHTQGWMNALETMQSGINKILNMILELFKTLGRILSEIFEKFASLLAQIYEYLRQMVQNVFDFFSGQSSKTQGYLERFKNWFSNFWGRFFSPKEPVNTPSESPRNAV